MRLGLSGSCGERLKLADDLLGDGFFEAGFGLSPARHPLAAGLGAPSSSTAPSRR
jgi:hypothetical protein